MDKNADTKALSSKLKISKLKYAGALNKPEGELNLIYYLSGEHTVTINGVTKKLSEDDITAAFVSDAQKYISNSGEVFILECDNVSLLQFKQIYQKYSFNSFMLKKTANRHILRNLEALLKINSEAEGQLLTLNDFPSMTPLLALNAFLRGKNNTEELDTILLQASHINNILYTIKKIYGFYSKTPDILHEIREYISSNSTSGLTRDEMATRFGYNKFYFSVFFKKHFGMNFVEYLNSLRYNLVKQKLSLNANKETKTSIILSSGFNSTLSYYRYAKLIETKQNKPK